MNSSTKTSSKKEALKFTPPVTRRRSVFKQNLNANVSEDKLNKQKSTPKISQKKQDSTPKISHEKQESTPKIAHKKQESTPQQKTKTPSLPKAKTATTPKLKVPLVVLEKLSTPVLTQELQLQEPASNPEVKEKTPNRKRRKSGESKGTPAKAALIESQIKGTPVKGELTKSKTEKIKKTAVNGKSTPAKTVKVSTDEIGRTLFVKNLPSDCKKEMLLSISDTICSVRIRHLLRRGKVAKCYAYIVFETEADAKHHLRSLVKVGGNHVIVNCVRSNSASPKSERPLNPLRLFVSGFDTTHTNITRQLNKVFTKSTKVELPLSGAKKHTLGYAFVWFKTEEEAEESRIATNGLKLGARTLTVSAARKKTPASMKPRKDGDGGPSAKKPKRAAQDDQMEVDESDIENFSDLENEDDK